MALSDIADDIGTVTLEQEKRPSHRELTEEFEERPMSEYEGGL